MYKLAVVPLGNGLSKITMQSSPALNIKYIEKHSLLKISNEIHGVLLEDVTEENSNYLFEMILNIKNKTSLPIWIYTENMQLTKKIVNLELGVVGHINEAISSREAQLMIRNTLGMIHHTSSDIYKSELNEIKEGRRDQPIFIQMNPDNLSLKVGENLEISLTQLEYRFCTLLMSKPNKAFTYEAVYKNVWEEKDQFDIYKIANLSFHIRQKLRRINSNPQIIKTVRSVGYMIDTTKIS